MNFTKHITDLLLKHDCVIVPGLGGFVSNYKSARIHPINHTFTPPSAEIVFNSSLNRNDGLLANHIAVELNVSYSIALEIIEHGAKEIRSQLITEKKAYLPGLGTLLMDQEGNIAYRPETEFAFLTDSFGLGDFVSPPIIRQGLRKHINDRIQKQKAQPAKVRRLYTQIRWSAAAAIPLLGIITWASLNIETIKDYHKESTELISSLMKNDKKVVLYEKRPVSISPDAHLSLLVGTPVLLTNDETTNTVTFPFDFTTNDFHPKDNYSPVDSSNITNNKTTITSTTGLNKYYIIGNCFKSEINADKYLNELKSNGYTSAAIIGTTPSGLHRVSFASYPTKEIAEAELEVIRRDNQKDAWLLEL